jgi:hypothetical protein
MGNKRLFFWDYYFLQLSSEIVFPEVSLVIHCIQHKDGHSKWNEHQSVYQAFLVQAFYFVYDAKYICEGDKAN